MPENSTPTDPWEAFVLDEDGYVMADHQVREWAKVKSEDLDAYWDGQEPNELVIVRGTARPRPQHEGDTILRQRGITEVWDSLVPEWDLWSEAPEDVVALWERAQGIAKGANEAGVR